MRLYLQRILIITFILVMGMTGTRIVWADSNGISNPRIEPDSSMEAKQNVTWDCIYFGMYPQTEIVDQPETSGIYGRDWVEEGVDYVVDKALYKKLKKAKFDEIGDTVIDGTKYRRISYANGTFHTVNEYPSDFTWEDHTDSCYHYFRYEPIKWRVLEAEDGSALLLSDVILDDVKYHLDWAEITWENSSIRGWLNGNINIKNTFGMNHESYTFVEGAFTKEEENAIQVTKVKGYDNQVFGTDGGNDTEDKIFLLSGSDLYNTERAEKYGFCKDPEVEDEAKRAESSTYAKAKGLYTNYDDGIFDRLCYWKLRSPGDFTVYDEHVHCHGNVLKNGYIVNYNASGVRVSLNLDLNSATWKKADTVSSKDMVNGIHANGHKNKLSVRVKQFFKRLF